jgi:hypothetical protein
MCGLALGRVTVMLGVAAFGSFPSRLAGISLPPILSARWQSREDGGAVER